MKLYTTLFSNNVLKAGLLVWDFFN